MKQSISIYKTTLQWLLQSAYRGLLRCLLLCVLISSVYADNIRLANKAVRLRDFDKAFQLYMQDAKAGNVEAQYQLAKLYLTGLGTEKNQQAAQRWLQKAAAHKHAAAQYNLALIIKDTNPEKSHELLQSAAAQNHTLAKKQLKNMESTVTPVISKPDLKELFFAAKKNDTKRLDALKKAGVNLKTLDKNRRSALYQAVEGRAVQAVTWLLKEGLSPTEVDKFGISPLSKAVEQEHFAIFSQLLKHKRGKSPVLPNGDSLLHQAIRKNNIKMVSMLLKSSAGVNVLNKEGWTPLDVAIYLKQKNTIKILGKYNAKTGEAWGGKNKTDVKKVVKQINEKSGSGHFSPVEEAIFNNNLPLFSQLIEPLTVEELSLAQKTGHTLLALSVRQGNLDMTKALLARGVSPNVANKFGSTPLMMAAKKGELSLIKSLTGSGADALIKNKKKRDSVSHAIRKKQSQAAIYLLKYLEENGKRYPAARYLLLASKYKQRKVIKHLARIHHQLDKYDSSGRNALWFACKGGQAEVIPDLLKVGIRPDSIDKNKQSMINVSASSGCLPCAKQLIESNDINHQTADGTTALMVVAKDNNKAFVQWLLENKADLELRNNLGNTALIHAVESKSEAVVDLLIEAGANATRKNLLGISALDIAKKSSPELYKKLKETTVYSFF